MPPGLVHQKNNFRENVACLSPLLASSCWFHHGVGDKKRTSRGALQRRPGSATDPACQGSVSASSLSGAGRGGRCGRELAVLSGVPPH